MLPAARISEMHVSPMVTGVVPHVGGPIGMGFPTVMIGFMPAARVGDMAVGVGPPDAIAKGSATVMIGSMPAAQMGNLTAHGGTIAMGCPTVMINDVGIGRAGTAQGTAMNGARAVGKAVLRRNFANAGRAASPPSPDVCASTRRRAE